MSERSKMLLTIPFWVPLALIGLTVNYVCHPSSFKFYWRELVDILKWAWHN
jgi:hypothetical protein